MRKIIASLDLGSDTIKLVVGEIYRNKFNILACVENPSRGIKNGFIINTESAIESLMEIFNKASEVVGIKINKVVTTVPSFGVECFYTEGKTSITSEDKVITHNDLIRAMQASVYNKVLDNQELISILPTQFVLNDIDKSANPIGSIAEKLTIKAIGVVLPKKNVIPIINCLKKINVEVVDTIIGPLGDYYETKSEEFKDKVGAVINIGSNKTEVSIFNCGILTNSEVINTGGEIIDKDIAYVYKVGKKDAVYLKENLSLAHKNLAQPNESMNVINKRDENIKINQYDITEITASRLEEILNLVKKQINILTKKEISYIIVSGGVTEYQDFDMILDEIFNHKARIGIVNEIGARNNKFVTSLGLIKYYYSRLKLRNVEFSIFSIEEQEELGGLQKKINISDDSILGKLFGYFFDN